MFYEKYKELFLGDGAPNQPLSQPTKNNAFSRNAEMLVGAQHNTPQIKGMGVDNMSFKPPSADYQANSRPNYSQTFARDYDQPKRPSYSIERQQQPPQNPPKPTYQMNNQPTHQQYTPQHNPGDYGSKAKDALTSDVLKQAFSWKDDENKRPPLPKKQQVAQNAQAAPSHNDDMVFGAFDRKDPNELNNGKAYRVDPNKNKLTYNFLTGEDHGQKKKGIQAPVGMKSEGVGDMFEVLREANSRNEQALQQQKILQENKNAGQETENSHNKDKNSQNLYGGDPNSFKRGLVHARKQQASSEDAKNLEAIANKVVLSSYQGLLQGSL